MAIDFERVRQLFLSQMERWLALLPDEARATPFIGVADGEYFTPLELLTQVRDKTPLGDQLFENIIGLLAAKGLQTMKLPSRDEDRFAPPIAFAKGSEPPA